MTISLNPSVEAVVASRAAAAGLGTEEFVNEFLERRLAGSETGSEGTRRSPMSQEEIDDFFGRLQALSSTVTGLADPNFGRETIYQDHD